jgi:hypothetical protein
MLQFLRTRYYENSTTANLMVAFVLALLAVLLGAGIGYAGPLLTAVAVTAVLVAFWAMTNLEACFYCLLAVIALLPFGTLPFKVVITPTFLDLALAGVIFIYLFEWMAGKRWHLALTPITLPLLIFWVLAVVAFIAGSKNGALTPNVLRKFAEFLLSMLFVIVIVDYVRTVGQVNRLVKALLLLGGLAALIGLVLYVLPTTVSQQLLDLLRVIGYYPNGGGVRFIEDNPELSQRAIGTWVDPNAFGGWMAMVGALMAPQLLARQPSLRPRWLVWLLFAVVGVMVVLTFSRSAMVGLLAGVMFLAVLRYRRLLLLFALIAVVFLFLPFTQTYIERFLAGLAVFQDFNSADLATQMRIGEYRDALTLIQRYPLLGVGFAGTPDVDIYLGVSSAYFLLAQEMGLIGLGAFLLLVVSIFAWGFWHWPAVSRQPALVAPWLGLHGGLVAALVVGFADHYFLNLEFHASQTSFWIFAGLGLACTRLASLAAKPAQLAAGLPVAREYSEMLG